LHVPPNLYPIFLQMGNVTVAKDAGREQARAPTLVEFSAIFMLCARLSIGFPRHSHREHFLAQKHVIVIGGGIIGASFAYHLAKAGARVTLLDEAKERGGVATPGSWAWINASWGNPENYFRLRLHAMKLWRVLDKTVPGLQVNWCGGLLWDLPENELRSYVKQQSAWGYDIKLVDQDRARKIEPNLAEPPELAAHAVEEGVVEPVHAVDCLLAAAEQHDAQVLSGVRAIRLAEDGESIAGVMTDDGVLEADDVVIAAGAASPQILKTVGISLPLDTPPGLLITSEPAPELLNGLVMAPELHVRQRPDGSLIAGSDFGGTEPGSDPEATAEQLFSKVKALVRGATNLKMAAFSIGYRPTPPDGVSVVGRTQGKRGLYVCVTHSGITLAPALGEFGAREILDGDRNLLLQPFGPDRLLARK
jgi:glycine/D-amino acid oxidase-like deaminating enzyme